MIWVGMALRFERRIDVMIGISVVRFRMRVLLRRGKQTYGLGMVECRAGKLARSISRQSRAGILCWSRQRADDEIGPRLVHVGISVPFVKLVGLLISLSICRSRTVLGRAIWNQKRGDCRLRGRRTCQLAEIEGSLEFPLHCLLFWIGKGVEEGILERMGEGLV